MGLLPPAPTHSQGLCSGTRGGSGALSSCPKVTEASEATQRSFPKKGTTGASPCTCWGLHGGSASRRPRHHHRLDLDMWASAQARRAVSPASTPAGIAETQPWHGVAATRDRQAEREPSPGGRSEAAGAQVHRACSASPFASAGEVGTFPN